MEYSNVHQYGDLGFEKIEFPEGDVVGRHYRLNPSKITRVHYASFTTEEGEEMRGLWLVIDAVARQPFVVKSVVHPLEEADQRTHGMDLASASGLDSIAMTINDIDYQVFPQIHAMQVPLTDGVNAVTTYLLLGLVLITDEDRLEGIINSIAIDAGLTPIVSVYGDVMWMTSSEAEHFAIHGSFVSETTMVLTQHYIDNDLLDRIDTGIVSEFGADTES